MDGRQSLGIALGDSGLSAVLLQVSGRATSVVATAALPLAPESPDSAGGQADAARALNRLCADLNRQPSTSLVLGLPLSVLSVHNLHLPFTGARQQAQALPFEMEERLLRPAEQVKSVYQVTASGANATNGASSTGGAELLAFALDKAFLRGLLPENRGREWIFDPDSICPSVQALAQQASASLGRSCFVLLHADLHSATLALVQAGTLQACRQLPLARDAEPADEQPDVPEGQVSRESAQALAAAIRQSLALFGRQQGAGRIARDEARPAAPSRLYLCGPLAEAEVLHTVLREMLQMPVERLRAPSDSAGLGRLSPSFDAALACALLGLQASKSGAQPLNFRTGAFAKTSSRLWQRKNAKITAALALAACVALVVFSAVELRSLKLKNEQLRREMTQVYRSAFPQVQVVRDPYMEMQAALRSETAAGALLLFSPDRESVLSLLADISSRIPEEVALSVNRFSLDQELVLLRGETASFKNVDQIRNLLAASPLFSEVRILSSTAERSGQESRIRFELRLKRSLAGGRQ
ncbi:MAG: type II secretion system protein GspL [bacterium]|nr:type II secretion system protein GspL [bacterium]